MNDFLYTVTSLAYLLIYVECLDISNYFNQMTLQDLHTLHTNCTVHLTTVYYLTECPALCNSHSNCIFYHLQPDVKRCTLCNIPEPSQPSPVMSSSLAPDTNIMTKQSCGVYKQLNRCSNQFVYKFGDFDSSYWVMNTPDNFTFESRFTAQFWTVESDGVIVYAPGLLSSQDDFYSIYMKAGHVIFAFDNGLGTAVIKTMNTYNDGRWHSLLVYKYERSGWLTVDSETITGSVAQRKFVDTQYISVGGVIPQCVDSANSKMVRPKHINNQWLAFEFYNSYLV